MAENTTILISKETRDKIKEIGKKGETYTDILNRMYKDLKLKESAEMLMQTDGYLSRPAFRRAGIPHPIKTLAAFFQALKAWP